jgi:hypothetical protein
MGWQGKRTAALATLLVAAAPWFIACGGNDSSGESASSADAGTTAATGSTGSTGTTGVSGATGTKGSSGGSKAPSQPSKGTTGDSSSQGSNDSGKTPASGKKKDKEQPGTGKPGPSELANLYSQARQVCKALTLDGLAHEYEVARTPTAVAKAYAKAYPANQRAAVYNGCKAGVS